RFLVYHSPIKILYFGSKKGNVVLNFSMVQLCIGYSTRFKPSRLFIFMCLPYVDMRPSFFNCDSTLIADSTAVPTILAKSSRDSKMLNVPSGFTPKLS